MAHAFLSPCETGFNLEKSTQIYCKRLIQSTWHFCRFYEYIWARARQIMIKRSQKKRHTRDPTQTRARLLKATIDLVAKKGADALSVKEVAKVANVSRAVTYQHFKDRDHLLREATGGISDLLLKSVVDSPPGSLEERSLHAARMILSNPEAAKLFVMDALAGKSLKTDHPLLKMLLRNLKEFRRSGRGRKDLDVEMSAYILIGVVSTLIMVRQQYRLVDVEILARRFSREWCTHVYEGIFSRGSLPKTKSSSGSMPRKITRGKSRSG